MIVGNELNIVHFANGSGGGVFSVIQNLLQFSSNPNIRNHVIFTINKNQFHDFKAPEIIRAKSIRVYNFSPTWNFYYTCKQLAKLLPDDKAVIVAHDWLELGMASNLGLQNPVVQFLHGDYDYYYDLAAKHSGIVDKYITVAENIKVKLVSSIPDRKKDIEYLRFPVPDGLARVEEENRCNIIFIGRLSEGKGYRLLPAIALELKKRNINAHWNIVGEDVDGLKDNITWDEKINVKYYGLCASEEVRKILTKMDFILLPSAFEGMPVTVIEAMKSGVIPLVNDIEGGIQELVIDGETGFKIKGNDISEYAMKIHELLSDGNAIWKIRNNCIEKANKLFDPEKNTRTIEELFKVVDGSEKRKKPVKVYGSKLDHPYLPNMITNTIRNINR